MNVYCRNIKIDYENKGKKLKIYTQNDKFTILENENYLYFIQMSGKEIESKSFDFAAAAIAEASDR